MPGNDNAGKGEFEAAAYFDGACTRCSQEVEWLRRGAGCRRILFVDISAPAFDPDRDAGIPIVRQQDCIQTRLKTGEVLQGVEAVRHLYGLALSEQSQRYGWLPLLSPVLDLGHRVLANRRLRRACERMARWCGRGGKLG
jgi:predicted DCC family thiol-disulfide oxidoreductase YuxK